MIEIITTYKIEFSVNQARELFVLLEQQKDSGRLTIDNDLILVYNQLRALHLGEGK